MKIKAVHGLAVVGVIAAGGLFYAATRTTGPVPMPRFTETRSPGPLQEHLITAEELTASPVFVPHAYPSRIAHGISQVVSYGFAPLYGIDDPQVAALPAEQAW